MMFNITAIRAVSAGQVCNLQFTDSIVVGLFRSNKYTGEGWGFRPFEVKKDGVAVWTYKANAETWQFAKLIEYGDDDYVVYTAGLNTVYSVLRLGSLVNASVAKFDGKALVIGGDSFDMVFDIKVAVALEEGLECSLSAEEDKILAKRREEAGKKHVSLLMEKSLKNEAAMRVREGFRSEILRRKTVEAWNADSKHFFGIPVTTDAEWMYLPDGKFCIMMENGRPSAAFIVMKKNSKVCKYRETPVSGEKPKPKIAGVTIPEALFVRLFTKKGETRSVPCFASLIDVKKLQVSGLNSGAWVGVATEGEGSAVITVYAVNRTSIETVGEFKKKHCSQEPVAST